MTSARAEKAAWHFGAVLPACLAGWAALSLIAVPVSGQGVDRKRTEVLLATFPKEVHDSTVLALNARHVAYILKAGSGETVVLDGKPQKGYGKVDALTFSPDSRTLAYAAESGGKWFMVTVAVPAEPGQTAGTPPAGPSGVSEHGPHERIGPPVFSPDGKRLAFVVQLAGGQRSVVIDGKPGPACDLVLEGRVVFSPDGSQVAYGAQRQEQWYLVVNGKELGPHAFLGALTGYRFSRDGKRLAFAAMDGKKKWRLIVDGEPQPLHDNVGEALFSADGKRLASVVEDEGRWRVVLDGKPQEPWEAIGEGTLAFSPDGTRLAYGAKRDGKWLVVASGKPGHAHDGLSDILFSPDSRRLAYVARVVDSEMVVLDGRPERVFDRIGGGSLVFSPNSRRLGYIARVGRARCVVIDGKRKDRYNMAGYLNFTPDSRYFVYAAISEGKAFSVVDDRESAARYDAIWNVRGGKIHFAPQKKFYYLAVKEGNLYRVEEEID